MANTSGCEPDIREFDPPQPPHKKSNGLIRKVSDLFSLHKGNFALSAKLEVSLVEVPLSAFAGFFIFEYNYGTIDATAER